MFASGPLALSALCWLQASAQVEAGSRVETRVGEIPIAVPVAVPGQASGTTLHYSSEDVLIAAVTPTLALFSRTSDNELQASYSSRFLWSVSDAAAQVRPLILQTLTLNDLYRPSKRSTWHMELHAIYGEEDSIALAQLLPGQATLPTSMKILSARGSTNASWRSTRLTTLSFQIGALHRQPIETATSATNTISLTTQSTVSATPALLYTVSRRSHLELSMPVSYYNSTTNTSSSTNITTPSSGPLNAFVFQPQVAWIDELSRWHQLSLAGGVSYADIITKPTGVGAPGTTASYPPYPRQPAPVGVRSTAQSYPSYPITPIVRTTLNSFLLKNRSVVLSSILSTGVSWYLDPVLGTGVPRALLDARIDATMGKRWSAGAYVNFATDASWSPLKAVMPSGNSVAQNGGYPNGRNGGFPDETVLTAGAPIRYTWAQLLFVEFAGRFTVRAPHLRVPDQYFHWGETEIWATLTLSAASKFPLGPS